MLIKQKHLEGIKAGTISLAFRKWKVLSISADSLIKTSVGIIRIVSVEEVNPELIQDAEAVAAGFSDARALTDLLDSQKEGIIYKIALVFHAEDPKVELRVQVEFDEDDLATLKKDLENLDKYSKVGKWTTKTLQGIQENPKLKAADLAVKVKKEKEWLKLNIRKLKALGLTISHEPGYTLSPRGEAYLSLLGK